MPVAPKDDVAYEAFSAQIREWFASFTGKPLFATDATGLFDAFLDGLPAEYRQHYTCHCCRRFVETFGGLVSISDAGVLRSVMWPSGVPEMFSPSVDAMVRAIYASSVTGIFLHGKPVWGTPITGEWHHMSVINAPTYHNLLKTPGQAMAEKIEDYQILRRSLAEFPQPIVEQAITLLKSEALYRSERVLGAAEWLLNIHQSVAHARSKQKDNLIWLAVATAPAGYCHVRSSMIGTLLEDLVSGLGFDAVARRFAEKMNPAQYQRSQVAPTVGNVQQAERIVEKLGLQNSLQRRYMTIDEIPAFVWRPQLVKAASPNGVFAGIATKQKPTAPTAMELPVTTMTWDKFRRTVLPTATKIEIKAENVARFAALVTAAHPDAPNILQWDNTASWYYHGGIDAEIRRRVEAAGGQYEDNEIRCSLLWNTYSDLDIHVDAPVDGHIFFGNKRGYYGYLDVDMNVSPNTLTPVENIRWRHAPAGNYRFYVHNYNDRNQGHNAYKVELEICGKVFAFEGVIGGTNSRIDLASFLYKKGFAPSIAANTITNGTAWGLELNQFYSVVGIVKSPNLWGDAPIDRAGDHTFFLIDGCKDTDQGKGRGFFNEMLKPDLREIRKTLEAYTANTPIMGAESASACGLGFSKDGEWNVALRVTSGAVVALYRLDRWD